MRYKIVLCCPTKADTVTTFFIISVLSAQYDFLMSIFPYKQFYMIKQRGGVSCLRVSFLLPPLKRLSLHLKCWARIP